MKEASGSDNARTKAFWRNFWKMNIIPRAKISVWRVLNNLTPSKMNLIAKGIDANPRLRSVQEQRRDHKSLSLGL